MPIWQILLLSFSASLLAVVPMFLWTRRLGNRAKARMIALAAGRRPLRQAGAQGFGVQSKGKLQVRPGSGGLVLFEDELVFVPLVGATDLRIPRASIIGVQRPRSHLGKSTGSQLLHVTWKDGDVVDAAAWQVRELDRWIADLGGERSAEAA